MPASEFNFSVARHLSTSLWQRVEALHGAKLRHRYPHQRGHEKIRHNGPEAEVFNYEF